MCPCACACVRVPARVSLCGPCVTLSLSNSHTCRKNQNRLTTSWRSCRHSGAWWTSPASGGSRSAGRAGGGARSPSCLSSISCVFSRSLLPAAVCPRRDSYWLDNILCVCLSVCVRSALPGPVVKDVFTDSWKGSLERALRGRCSVSSDRRGCRDGTGGGGGGVEGGPSREEKVPGSDPRGLLPTSTQSLSKPPAP